MCVLIFNLVNQLLEGLLRPIILHLDRVVAGFWKQFMVEAVVHEKDNFTPKTTPFGMTSAVNLDSAFPFSDYKLIV